MTVSRPNTEPSDLLINRIYKLLSNELTATTTSLSPGTKILINKRVDIPAEDGKKNLTVQAAV